MPMISAAFVVALPLILAENLTLRLHSKFVFHSGVPTSFGIILIVTQWVITTTFLIASLLLISRIKAIASGRTRA